MRHAQRGVEQGVARRVVSVHVARVAPPAPDLLHALPEHRPSLAPQRAHDALIARVPRRERVVARRLGRSHAERASRVARARAPSARGFASRRARARARARREREQREGDANERSQSRVARAIADAHGAAFCGRRIRGAVQIEGVTPYKYT